MFSISQLHIRFQTRRSRSFWILFHNECRLFCMCSHHIIFQILQEKTAKCGYDTRDTFQVASHLHVAQNWIYNNKHNRANWLSKNSWDSFIGLHFQKISEKDLKTYEEQNSNINSCDDARKRFKLMYCESVLQIVLSHVKISSWDFNSSN